MFYVYFTQVVFKYIFTVKWSRNVEIHTAKYKNPFHHVPYVYVFPWK